MKQKPIIRFAQPKDLDSLVKLCHAHAAFEKTNYNEEGKTEQLKSLLFKSNKIYCLVVEYNNILIGYTTYMTQYSTWDANTYFYMDCLYLDEASRGFGIGEKLIQKIKNEAIALGIGSIQWQTPDFNEKAIKFYKRIGAFSKSKARFFLKF